jgi:hypothetical protein
MPRYLIVHPREQRKEDILIEDPHLTLTVTDQPEPAPQKE